MLTQKSMDLMSAIIGRMVWPYAKEVETPRFIVAYPCREEGVRAFWRGNGTNVIRIFPYSAVQFSTNDAVKRLLASQVGPPAAFNGTIHFYWRAACFEASALLPVLSTYSDLHVCCAGRQHSCESEAACRGMCWHVSNPCDPPLGCCAAAHVSATCRIHR